MVCLGKKNESLPPEAHILMYTSFSNCSIAVKLECTRLSTLYPQRCEYRKEIPHASVIPNKSTQGILCTRYFPVINPAASSVHPTISFTASEQNTDAALLHQWICGFFFLLHPLSCGYPAHSH